MPSALKKTVHIVLFLVAFVVFYVGLGMGLTRDPNLGTALWAAAAVIAVGNIVWIARTRQK